MLILLSFFIGTIYAKKACLIKKAIIMKAGQCLGISDPGRYFPVKKNNEDIITSKQFFMKGKS